MNELNMIILFIYFWRINANAQLGEGRSFPAFFENE